MSPVEDDLDAMGSPKPERPTSNPFTLGANALKEGKPAKPDGMEPGSPESQAGDDHKSKPNLQPRDPVSENPSDSSIGDDVNTTPINSSHGKGEGHGIGNSVVGVDGIGGDVGSLFLRLQLTLPDKDAPVTTEDLETSRALQILLGETFEGGTGRQGSGGTGGAGSNDAGAASDVNSTSDKNGKQNGSKDSGGFAASRAPSSVARLIGLPMGVLTTARDVQDNVSEALDKLEVKCCILF